MRIGGCRGWGASIGWPSAICLLLAACSGGASSSEHAEGGTGAGGGAATAGTGSGGLATSSAGGATSAGGQANAVGGVTGKAFWCPDYPVNNTAAPEGWISISSVVMQRGSGSMTSPIQSCNADASDWSVSANGTERDGVDQTTMSFHITGKYTGPGRYSGTLTQGISAAFSHDDLGAFSFASIGSSECDLCVNDGGLSGTVSCWGLETPAGSALNVAYIPFGSFTCANAPHKPTDAANADPEVSAISSASVLCHYLERLGCAGRPAAASCIMHSDHLVLDGPCAAQWTAWIGCLEDQRPSAFQCAKDPEGDVLTVAGGECDSELGSLRACRSGMNAAGGAQGAGGSAGSNMDVADSAECGAFCDALRTKCGITCERSIDCVVYPNECPAAVRAYLSCAAEGDALACGQGGYSIANCSRDTVTCP